MTKLRQCVGAYQSMSKLPRWKPCLPPPPAGRHSPKPLLPRQHRVHHNPPIDRNMQQRTFTFQDSGPGAAQAEVRLWCREPPEAQAGKTLTWQLDGRPCSGGQQPPDGAAQPAAAPAAASAAAADPDLIGLDIWPASIALCRYLVNHPELVAGQHVLELGAGGLAWVVLGARDAPLFGGGGTFNVEHPSLWLLCGCLRLNVSPFIQHTFTTPHPCVRRHGPGGPAVRCAGSPARAADRLRA